MSVIVREIVDVEGKCWNPDDIHSLQTFYKACKNCVNLNEKVESQNQ